MRAAEIADELLAVIDKDVVVRRQADDARVRIAAGDIRQIESPGGGAPVQVLEGRYGPYVSDGETNASIPRGTDPNSITLEEARALLDARRGAPPREKRAKGAGAARRRRPSGASIAAAHGEAAETASAPPSAKGRGARPARAATARPAPPRAKAAKPKPRGHKIVH